MRLAGPWFHAALLVRRGYPPTSPPSTLYVGYIPSGRRARLAGPGGEMEEVGMGHVRPVERSQLDNFEKLFGRFERAMGYVPNSLFVMGHRPDLLEAFARLVGVITGPGAVDQGLKQLVALVASGVSGCRYCQAHTASLATNYGVEVDRVDEVWELHQSDLVPDS